MALMHLDNITVGERVRALNEAKVLELVESIRELGLLNPITVTDEGLLVAGFHRLEACKRLASEDDAYAIVSVSYFEQAHKTRQAEIAENLFRNELSVLERAEHLALYLDNLEQKLPAAEQAAALGMSRKTFFNYRRLVRDIPVSLRERIKQLDSDLRNSTRQLLELAALPAPEQESWMLAVEQTEPQTTASKNEQTIKTKRKSVSVSVPAPLQTRLQNSAARHGLNQGEFTRRLLDKALNALETGEWQLPTTDDQGIV